MAKTGARRSRRKKLTHVVNTRQDLIKHVARAMGQRDMNESQANRALASLFKKNPRANIRDILANPANLNRTLQQLQSYRARRERRFSTSDLAPQQQKRPKKTLVPKDLPPSVPEAIGLPPSASSSLGAL